MWNLQHSCLKPLLENVANVFIFRLQDRQSIEALSKNYNILPSEMVEIQRLGIGSCMLIQLHGKESRSAFFIRRIEGAKADKILKIGAGDNMEVRIGRQELEKFIADVAGSDAAVIDDGDYVDLAGMIAGLLHRGADRHVILSGLSKMGLSDFAIADAFSKAIDEPRK